MEVRPVRPDEHTRLGELTVEAYRSLEGGRLSQSYAAVLRDVAGRAVHAEVLVAVAEDGTLLGGVTYVPGPDSSSAEFERPDEAGIRALAVSPAARGGGVGTALTVACIAAARADGKARVSLMTTPWMAAAHRIYERLGFRRAPECDMIAERDTPLRAYVLDL